METAGTETAWADRMLIALVAALVGFAIRAAYDGWKDRRKAKRRDRQVLEALVRELSVMRGFIATTRSSLTEELELIERTEGQRWSITPLTPLPINAYDLVRADPPGALLEGRTLGELALAVANAAHANAIQEARQAYKGLPRTDGGEATAKFNLMLLRSLDNVERYVNPVMQVATAALAEANRTASAKSSGASLAS